MAGSDNATLNSVRLQRAYRINGIEEKRMYSHLRLLDKEKKQAMRLTTQDIRMLTLTLDFIKSSTGYSPEARCPDVEQEVVNTGQDPYFLYGDRVRSRMSPSKSSRKKVSLSAASRKSRISDIPIVAEKGDSDDSDVSSLDSDFSDVDGEEEEAEEEGRSLAENKIFGNFTKIARTGSSVQPMMNGFRANIISLTPGKLAGSGSVKFNRITSASPSRMGSAKPTRTGFLNSRTRGTAGSEVQLRPVTSQSFHKTGGVMSENNKQNLFAQRPPRDVKSAPARRKQGVAFVMNSKLMMPERHTDNYPANDNQADGEEMPGKRPVSKMSNLRHAVNQVKLLSNSAKSMRNMTPSQALLMMPSLNSKQKETRERLFDIDRERRQRLQNKLLQFRNNYPLEQPN